MYKILVIDDEQAIVNGLVETLNREELELQIYSTATVLEGIKIAKEVKLDILCTDINMPGMDGFEFAKVVMKYWKDCKILFLTGYDTFDYVYKAIHEFGANYVLKDEEDKLIEAIKRYMTQVEERQQEEIKHKKMLQLMDENKKDKKNRAWGEYLQEEPGNEKSKILCNLYVEEEIDFHIPLKCAIGRALKKNSNESDSHRDLYQYFLKAKEEYAYFYTLDWISLYNDLYLIIAQKKREQSPGLEDILNGLQDAFMKFEEEKVSFLYSEDEVGFEKIGQHIKLYKTLMNVKWSENNPVLINMEELLEENRQNYFRRKQYGLEIDKRLMEKKFTELEDIFLALYLSVKNTDELSLADTQMYYKCIGIVASYIEENVNYSDMPEALQRSYYHLRYMSGINEIHNFVIDFLKYMELYEGQKEGLEDTLVIQKIESYVMNHITEEITVSSLARMVYFNPSYLSRFYKAATGKNLSRFIKDVKIIKAKELLEAGDKKIEDIARMLGFESSGYFTVFFKKQVGMTPTEYRSNI